MTGATSFSGFPTTTGAFQRTSPGALNAFVTKFAANGSTLLYSTYLGGGSRDQGQGIAVDGVGNAYVTGATDSTSTNFPILNAFQPTRGGGGADAFVTKINAAGSGLIYSSFLGGSENENPGNSGYRFGLSHIAVDDAGRAYVAGWTGSQDFATTPDAFQRANRGGYDAFVVKVGAGTAGAGLSLESIVPNHGGNSGVVSTRIHGAGFASGMTIRLARAGSADIPATSVTVERDGDLATAFFDLREGSPGLWEVVVGNPDAQSSRLHDAFKIEAGGKPIIWSDIIGRKAILRNTPVAYTVIIGNRGNVDALGAFVFIGGLPKNATLQPNFEILPPPGNDPSIDWHQYSPYVTDPTNANVQILPLFVPILRAGRSITFRITLSVPASQVMTLSLSVMGPLFELGQLQTGTRSRHSVNTSEPAFACEPGLAANIWDCLTSIPIPGPSGCIVGLADLIKSAACGDLGGGSDATAAGALFSVTWAMTKVFLGCGGAAAIGKAFDAANASVGLLTGCLGLANSLGVFIASAFDPNDKVGSEGAGEAHYLTGEEPLRYMIFFENKPEATAPAHEVVITDQLDPNLDLTTFQPGAVAFGERQASLKPDGSQFSTSVDLRPEKNLLVRINAGLNPTTGVLTWRFTSIDPATDEMPEDVEAGFLPPNRISPEGTGNVFFTIMPKVGITSGTEIRNRASIVFDFNESISTPEWLNTIDSSKPTSRVTQLDTSQSSVIFDVNWSATDTGSGVQSYTIFVSENGGPFTAWISNTTATSGFFPGQPAKTYSFYSIARDQTGNIENAKTSAEASTTTTSSFSNSVDDPRFFVWQHYLDFLNRTPDQVGWDYWTSQITQCGSDQSCIRAKRINVSAAFFLSIEFQQTGYLVERIYKAAFGDASGTSTTGGPHQLPVPIVHFNEFLTDTQRIRLGVVAGQNGWETVLENNKEAFASEFVQRTRFTAAYSNTMTPAQFVNQLFANVGVTPSVTDRNAAIAEFGSATNTSDMAARARALRDVAENSLLQQQEFNRAFVLMQFIGYLRRNPNDAPDSDYTGYDFWLTKLNAFNGNFVNAEMVKAFITSAEYRQRFGP